MNKLGITLLSATLALSSSITQAEMVVIVSIKNPVSILRIDQVEQLFLGKFYAFPDGSQALALDLPKGPARDAFYQRIAGRNNNQMKAYWSKIVFSGSGQPPKEATSAQDVVSQVAKSANLIGYVDKAAINNSVKIVLLLP
jgi:ABC-type phosphate transport system substrate-binding protein